LASFESLREWACFDADSGKDSAREIREYFIPDFSDRKNYDNYQRAFGPFLKTSRPKSITKHNCRWLKPQVVARIDYLEWTAVYLAFSRSSAGLFGYILARYFSAR
jgi:hypothetical protein